MGTMPLRLAQLGPTWAVPTLPFMNTNLTSLPLLPPPVPASTSRPAEGAAAAAAHSRGPVPAATSRTHCGSSSSTPSSAYQQHQQQQPASAPAAAAATQQPSPAATSHSYFTTYFTVSTPTAYDCTDLTYVDLPALLGGPLLRHGPNLGMVGR